ncbi:hypothetical protein [Saccharibacillus alkalitolerans]|uniref:hypothetical protein n=1 Tax=Saccharibacillus alkalitolerans TaxID=2705290 RepID=UPI001407D9BF|nr:hypothetical protein [Saccharibacillus alkalitolerans]
MNMSVHNLMAFHSNYFRPQPAVSPQKNAGGEQEKSFQEILKEKMARPVTK